jgi:hypothetical protein
MFPVLQTNWRRRGHTDIDIVQCGIRPAYIPWITERQENKVHVVCCSMACACSHGRAAKLYDGVQTHFSNYGRRRQIRDRNCE